MGLNDCDKMLIIKKQKQISRLHTVSKSAVDQYLTWFTRHNIHAAVVGKYCWSINTLHYSLYVPNSKLHDVVWMVMYC